MNSKTKIALAGGLVAVFLAICFFAFNLGKNNASSDSPSVLMPDVGGTFTNLDGVDTLSDEMRLDTFHGTLSMSNSGTAKTPVAGSRLVSGDNMETMAESQAYVVLDQSKVLRVNQTSQVEVGQVAEDLDIYLRKGSVFFNVTAPLSVDETLEFHTGNVVTGVRGTAGVISASEKYSQVAILAGTVFCVTTSGDNFAVEAGQVAIVTSHDDGSVSFEILSLEEDDLYFYFTDDFIDPIQGDLKGEANSVPLSETLRKPLETRTTGKVLALNRTVAIEDANGNLLTFDNSSGQSWSGVTLGGMVNLSYAEGRVISMEQTSQGADVVGAYLQMLNYWNFYYQNSTLSHYADFPDFGNWDDNGLLYMFYDLAAIENLSQAEKEAYLLRQREAYPVNSGIELRLGDWDDLEAIATTPLIPGRDGPDSYANMGWLNSAPLSVDYANTFNVPYTTTGIENFSIGFGIWGSNWVQAVLNPATGQYTVEYLGGVS